MSERGKTKGGCMAVIKTPVAYQKRTALTGPAEHFKIKWGQSIIEGFQPSQNIIVKAFSGFHALIVQNCFFLKKAILYSQSVKSGECFTN
jgi:hypothetical protein